MTGATVACRLSQEREHCRPRIWGAITPVFQSSWRQPRSPDYPSAPHSSARGWGILPAIQEGQRMKYQVPPNGRGGVTGASSGGGTVTGLVGRTES